MANANKRIQYIDNDPTLGIKYDWGLIEKEYRKLGVPPEYDITQVFPFGNEALKWYIGTSERSVGKTTNVLLLGMIMNKIYGTITQLVRHHVDKASYYETLFNSIIAYNRGQYIKALTDGKYNSVKYHWKNFYYSKMDEKGKILKDEKPFCVSLSADECYNLCSFYEAPFGDWIVLDECFNESNRPEEFVHFVHLHKTIVRDRMSDKIILLGNNLDVNNIWYRQLIIHNEVRKMHKGQGKIVYTPEGMPIFVAFMENRMPEKRRLFNKAHYGFDNPMLNAITGNGNWNVRQYPQTCMLQNRERMAYGELFFSYHDDLFMGASFIECDSGLYLEVHPEHIYRDDIPVIFTLTFPKSSNEILFGYDKLSRLIMKMLKEQRVVYSDNETGDLFRKFMQESIKLDI